MTRTLPLLAAVCVAPLVQEPPVAQEPPIAQESPIASSAPAGPQSRPDAKTLLERVESVYATCRTYRDRGTVTTKTVAAPPDWLRWLHPHDHRFSRQDDFTTAFVRPDRFRFETTYAALFAKKDAHRIVWSDAKRVCVGWDGDPAPHEVESLAAAFAATSAAATGVVLEVPALLLPESSRPRIGRLQNLESLTYADSGGPECFRVRGTDGKETVTLWIDKKSFLLRRIDTTRAMGNSLSERTTTYEPVVDSELPAEDLAFRASETPASRPTRR
ncbi:MAG TPA: hypothetical protein VKE69_11610 [Planctomycetota bacterium]|nr:hypothetical protein [Planctomycetota bacterium]